MFLVTLDSHQETIIITIVLILISLFVIFKKQFGKTSIVHEEFPNPEKARNLLIQLGKNGQILVDYAIKKFPNDVGIKQLKRNYNPRKLSEGSPDNTNFTFTENKQNVVLCLRNSDYELHDLNLVMFPLIHELAHMADPNYDPEHGPSFLKYFRILIDCAVKSNVYRYIDFSVIPNVYCGIEIHNNP